MGSTTNDFQFASSGGSAISLTGTGNDAQWFGTTGPAHVATVGANANQTVTMSLVISHRFCIWGLWPAINYWNIKTESRLTALSGLNFH